MTNTRKNILKLTYSAVCIALAMVLPLITAQIPQIGKSLSPMHIPVFLCGFLCGWQYGAAVGVISPLLRSLIFSTPHLMPDAVVMSIELLTYGLLAGLLYKLLPKKIPYIYITLILSMIGGRIVWGTVKYLFFKFGLGVPDFSFDLFIAGAITNALPGIILHIVLVPVIIMAMRKAKLTLND